MKIDNYLFEGGSSGNFTATKEAFPPKRTSNTSAQEISSLFLRFVFVWVQGPDLSKTLFYSFLLKSIVFLTVFWTVAFLTSEPSTTVLSPYLKFGCLSPRTMYWQLVSVYQVGLICDIGTVLLGF
jgi:hypothetical protein